MPYLVSGEGGGSPSRRCSFSMGDERVDCPPFPIQGFCRFVPDDSPAEK